jgi:hypothetical protein
MAPPFRKISLDQLAALVKRYPFDRPVDSVLLLPSERPEDTPVDLWMRDTRRGEPDVAWHLAADPGGGFWLGRDWNLPVRRSGEIVLLVLGGPAAARDEAERAAALIQGRFRRTTEGLESVSLAPPDGELILGDDDEPAGETADGGTILLGDDDAAPSPAPPPAAAGDAATDDLLLTLLRSGGPAQSPAPQGTALTGEEIPFLPQPITVEIKEVLRPHTINLTEGRFSTGGLFATGRDDVDAIFDDHLERAVAGHGAGNPLRIVIWAHGGLVNERDGLLNAHKHILWWRRNGVYPLYFVWETGFMISVRQLLRGGGGGEEGVFETVSEVTDRRLENVARAAHGPDIWGVMKKNARAAVDPDTGGAAYAAAKLADFCKRHPGAVELHAAGHSAGSIFHMSFIPAALDKGVPPFKGLYLLAPAVRADLFLERLAPRLGTGKDKGVERTAIFTMNKDRERADNCAVVYRKSLLYLIYFALEEQRETPILGLEISLRGDAKLKALFGLDGGGGAVGEVIWSKSPDSAGPRDRSRSTSHGGFDDDPATMDSVLRRVLDNDTIALSFEQAGKGAAAETALAAPPPPAAAPPAPEAAVLLGDEEEEEVPFVVLDAVERAAEAAEGIGPQASRPDPQIFLEAVETIDIAFGPNAKAADVTAFSRQVLTDILRAAGLTKVTVSSTSRLPADQARVMYANLERQGIEAQRKLYKEPGRKVIEVYRQGKLAGKDAATIQGLMKDEIVRLGPTTVSRHASDPKILNVFDVAPSSVAKRPQFEAAVRAEKRVAKFLLPPNDPGYHLEIPQPQAG